MQSNRSAGQLLGGKLIQHRKLLVYIGEGQSYVAVLEGQMPAGVGVPAEGRGSRAIWTKPEKGSLFT
jgi:hypothetical protein